MLASRKARLRKLEQAEQEPSIRYFTCYTDEEPPAMGSKDLLIVLSRKCATAEEWYESMRPLRETLRSLGSAEV